MLIFRKVERVHERKLATAAATAAVLRSRDHFRLARILNAAWSWRVIDVITSRGRQSCHVTTFIELRLEKSKLVPLIQYNQ